MEELDKPLTERTRLVAVAHMSNALGTMNPVAEIVEHRARARRGRPDRRLAGRVSHLPVDVQALDCDFYAATGHKLYGPTGIGVLYGSERASRPCRPSSAAAT